MTKRSYGFHSPEAALALIMLAVDRSSWNCRTAHEPTHIDVRRAKLCNGKAIMTSILAMSAVLFLVLL